MKIAVVAATLLATIIPSTAVDASHRQLSNNNDDDSNKPKRLRGENAVLTSRVKRQQRQLERGGTITRGVVRGEEQLLSMQPIEKEPVAIIDEENTPPTAVIEQIDCNTMNKKQCKRVAEEGDIPKLCTWDGQVCTSTVQVSFLQVDDACAQYTTQKKCRKKSPCEWQEEGEEDSCSTPGFVAGIIKPQSTNAPTTYSPTTPYPSYFPTLFPTLSPSLSPVDLSISMSMMTFLEEEDMEEEDEGK